MPFWVHTRGKFNDACAMHDEYALDRRQQSFVALSDRSRERARKVVGVSDVADPQLDPESTRRGFDHAPAARRSGPRDWRGRIPVISPAALHSVARDVWRGAYLRSPRDISAGARQAGHGPRPDRIAGSPETIGIVLVACFAARAPGVVSATMMSALSRTHSAARAGNRAKRPSAERKSMMRLRPSV